MSTTVADLRKSQQKKHSMGELQAMPPKQRVATFLQDNKQMIADALPRHIDPDRLLVVAQSAVTQNPKLLKCTTESLFGALIKCTQVGLEPNNALGECYIIPYGNEAQFQFGYPGQMKMIRNSGEITSLTPRAVHQADEFDYAYGLDYYCKHKPAMVDPGPLTHVYLVATYKNGSKEFWVWSREDMIRHRDTYVKAKSGPWYGSESEFEAMCLKTTINLAAKWLPKSVEMAEMVALDLAHDAGRKQHLDKVLTGEFEVVTDDILLPVSPEPEPVVDVNGEVFDPELHATDEDGEPIYNKDQSFRKRPQRKAPAQQDAAEEEQEQEQEPAGNMPPDDDYNLE